MPEVETKKIKQASADDFEDDFLEEEAIYSDNEPAIEDDEAPEIKRKNPPTSTKEGDEQEQPKKKKKKQPKKKVSGNPFDTINIHTEERDSQAKYLADRQKIAMPKLSSVELEEQSFPTDALVNNANFSEEHILTALANYVKYGVMGHKKLQKKPTVLASPVALILTHSAVRAVDLGRALKEFATTAKVAKLFAKHFKIEDQIYFLEHEAIHMAVCTPNRLQALVDQGHLKLDKLELIVIDTEKNAKKFNIFDNQEVRSDLFNFLGQHISPLMKESKTKIGLF